MRQRFALAAKAGGAFCAARSVTCPVLDLARQPVLCVRVAVCWSAVESGYFAAPTQQQKAGMAEQEDGQVRLPEAMQQLTVQQYDQQRQVSVRIAPATSSPRQR